MPVRNTEAVLARAQNLSNARPDVSKELASLKFEMKNRSQPRLPPNRKVERRPLNHAPIASPYAGASVQKVVYVSRNTPLMSAVKRVRKLLSHIEKRAMQDVDLAKDRNGMEKLAEASEKLAKEGEEVLVKASGKAMQQALRIAEWFRSKEQEMVCKVEVRTGSVQAVDDIVEVAEEEAAQDGMVEDTTLESTQPEESTGLRSSGVEVDNSQVASKVKLSDDAQEEQATQSNSRHHGKSPRRRQKRKRQEYDKDDIPEARVRWIKTVEVAISLRG